MSAMRVVFGLVVVCVLASTALAQPVDPSVRARADAAYKEGTTAYAAGQYTQAALKFEEAYSLVNDPAYLFNIGQAYRQADECTKAADAFQKFIELAPDAPTIGKAKEALEEVNVCAIFVEGRRLMGAGRPAEACEKFALAYKKDPGAIGTLLNLGLCNEQTGKLATAADWFRKAEKKAVELKIGEAQTQAKQRLEGIAGKIPKVKIEISPPSPKSIVKLDGTAVTAVGQLEVDPGRHTIEVVAPGKKPATTTFEIAIGGSTVANVALVAADGSGPRSNTLPYVLGGTGVALWVGTAVLGFVGKQQYEKAATFDEQDKWKNIVRYGGTTMFVLGTAAVTTSIVFYIRNRDGRHEETAVLAPAIGPNEVGLAFGRSF
jgi:tetratricopeptide (TPR) repeat protein